MSTSENVRNERAPLHELVEPWRLEFLRNSISSLEKSLQIISDSLIEPRSPSLLSGAFKNTLKLRTSIQPNISSNTSEEIRKRLIEAIDLMALKIINYFENAKSEERLGQNDEVVLYELLNKLLYFFESEEVKETEEIRKMRRALFLAIRVKK